MFVFTYKLHWTEPKPERAVKGLGVYFVTLKFFTCHDYISLHQ